MLPTRPPVPPVPADALGPAEAASSTADALGSAQPAASTADALAAAGARP